MARRLIVAFFLAGIPISMTSCGTFANTFGFDEEAKRRIYGGVRADGQQILENLAASDPDKKTQDSSWKPLVDLPFSFIGDTVTLPITVPVSLWRAVAANSNDERDKAIDSKISLIQLGQSETLVYEQLGYPEQSSTSGPPGQFIKSLDYWKLGITVLVDSKGKVIDISRSRKLVE